VEPRVAGNPAPTPLKKIFRKKFLLARSFPEREKKAIATKLLRSLFNKPAPHD
jgi:hypothetical protein